MLTRLLIVYVSDENISSQSCASTQERIVTRLLNLPGDYYSNVVQRKMRPNRNALTDVAGTPEKGKNQVLN